MTPPDARPSASAEDQLKAVNWEEVRQRMMRVISANLRGRASREDIEDMVGEARVGLIRAVLRGGIESLEAMQVTIAKRTAIDFMRRKGWTRVAGSDSGDADEILANLAAPAIDEEETLPPEEAQFYVNEILEAVEAKCRELFRHWMGALNLKTVADRLGITHMAIRQRWVRCRDRVREILRADDGPLGAWARELPSR